MTFKKYLLPTLLVISFILFHNYKRSLYTWSLLRNHIVKRKFNKIVQNVLDTHNLGEWQPSEFRHIDIQENDLLKKVIIEVYILKDKNRFPQWNDPEKLILIHATLDKDDNVLDVMKMEDYHSKDLGMLLWENTSNILRLSLGLPGKLREFVTSKRTDKQPVVYKDTPKCYYTASKSVMCDSKTEFRTDQPYEKPIFDLPDENRNVSNEWKSHKNDNPAQYQCELMKPYFSQIKTGHNNDTFVCKQRYDLDINPNVLEPDLEAKKITGELMAYNS